MATRTSTQPRADQPRVSTESLKAMSKPASIQYRNTGTPNLGTQRTTRSSGRETVRL